MKFTNWLIVVFILLAINACKEEEVVEPPIALPLKTAGFVVVGTTSSETALAKYIETLPETVVDLSDGTDFPRFFPTSIVDASLFLPRPDQAAGFSKYVVDADGDLEEAGVLPTVSQGSFRIQARDADLGVYHDRATPNTVTVFNPTTLEIRSTIDMSAGPVPGDIDQRYQRFVFRGDEIYAPIRGEDGSSFPEFIVHSANLVTGTFVNSTARQGNGVSEIVTTNNFGQGLVDTDGSLYIQDAGNFEGTGIGGRVNKIPAGSTEFDPTYVFEPALLLNPLNIFLPAFNSFKLFAPGRAIAKVNASTPQAAIDIVIGAGGVGNLSTDQVDEIFDILFSAETAAWCVLDLEAKTVTPIDGVPLQGVFSGGTTFEHDGGLYLPISTTSESAYYRYDIATGVAAKAFDVTGADILGIFNLSIDN
ncbi:MAG: hypothetical protein AAF598_02340 [Bacteroidota bacterium]